MSLSRRAKLASLLGWVVCVIGLPARAQQPSAEAPAASEAPTLPSPEAPAPEAPTPEAPVPEAPAAPPTAEGLEPAAPEAPAPPPKESKKKKKKKEASDKAAGSDDDGAAAASARTTVGARLMMGFERQSERPAGAQTDPARTKYAFTIRQIRLSVKGELAQRFRVNASFDLSDALEPETGINYDQPPYLRTATVEWRPAREFRLQVGRFKRPFSHLELESASDLPILRRGLFNGLALEDNQWGDRAIGVMASGRLTQPKLRWYLSLMNPDWSTTLPTQGVDVIGRVEWTVIKGLVLGANAAYKSIELGNDHLHDVAYGGDVALELGHANILLESNSVALPFEVGRPRALGALLLFDYELPMGDDWSLQPTLFAEYADANTDVLQNESLRLVLGLNLLGYSGFRVMPQVELVRSIGDTSAENPWPESERLSLIFSLVL